MCGFIEHYHYNHRKGINGYGATSSIFVLFFSATNAMPHRIEQESKPGPATPHTGITM